jgi:serine/threonine protein kinase
LEGRFVVQKKLGSGAFGEIYKVEKKKTKQFYAAKIVSELKQKDSYLDLSH